MESNLEHPHPHYELLATWAKPQGHDIASFKGEGYKAQLGS